MKVFLSHSARDKVFVTKLAAAMSANGFTPWLCEEDIDSGANFVAKISEGLNESDLTLLVWSPDAANSVWTRQEWTSILKQEVEQSRIRLGLIMLRQYQLPPLLVTKNFIDARTDHDTAIQKTLDWLRHRENAQRLSGLKAPVYLPDYRSQDFVGRTAYLDRLRDTFSGDPKVFLLHGEPGTGKSTLALEFAWTAQKDFDAVVFQTCGQRPLDALTAELAAALPIRDEVKTLAPDRQRDALKQWLRQRQSLLILDDVWPGGDGHIDIRELEPGPACSVLYTARLSALPGITPKQTSKVEKFTTAEAEELFHTYLDEVFSKEEVDHNKKTLLGFAARVEMLPIAVSVGASLLRHQAASALGKAVLKLQLDKLSDGVKDVNALFRAAIESQPQREQKLLAACAVCVQEGFWLPLAAQIAELTEDDADDAANALVRGSLLRVLDRDRRRFQLHALLREQLRTRAGAEGLAGLQERHASALQELFKDWETRWQDCRESLEEINPAAEFLWNRGERPRENLLADWGYRLAARVGELDTGFRILHLDELLRNLMGDGASKSELEAVYENMANTYFRWGSFEESLALHKKAEAIAVELDDKARLQVIYGNQAVIFQVWGRFDEALALHKREEAIALELGDHDQLQRSLGNQALLLKAWGRLEEAMALEKKQEAICLELGNQDSLQKSYGNQGLILKEWGRLEEAMVLLQEQEVICRQLGSKDGLQTSYVNQASILIRQGKLPEAHARIQDAEAICMELGNRSGLGFCYGRWADLEAACGDRAAQKQRLQQALAVFAELNMPRELDEVQAELDRLPSAEPPADS